MRDPDFVEVPEQRASMRTMGPKSIRVPLPLNLNERWSLLGVVFIAVMHVFWFFTLLMPWLGRSPRWFLGDVVAIMLSSLVVLILDWRILRLFSARRGRLGPAVIIDRTGFTDHRRPAEHFQIAWADVTSVRHVWILVHFTDAALSGNLRGWYRAALALQLRQAIPRRPQRRVSDDKKWRQLSEDEVVLELFGLNQDEYILARLVRQLIVDAGGTTARP